MGPVTSRYDPRRRALSARDARASAAKAGAHRRAKQRNRAGLLAFALTITVLVGAAGVGLLPRLQEGTPAAASTVIASSAFENTYLEVVKAPKAEPAEEPAETEALAAKVEASSDALPDRSGIGKRIVFSESEQRVWLVNPDGSVMSTYKVSGSIHDNLDPGTYAVQSHTRYATSYDYGSHMEYFVRFTSGPNAAIGFHDIPVSNGGSLLQTTAQLGTPLSSGCVRQERADAIRLWNFAPVGTRVVVLA